MVQEFTHHQIMDALRFGGLQREAAWRYVTKNWGGYCCGIAVKKTGCDEREVREAFSIACFGVDKRIRTTTGYDFLKTASLKTYLSSATIFAARAVIGQRKKGPGDEAIKLHTDEEEGPSNWFRQKDCREIMEKALAKIGERCKKILLLFTDGFGMNVIMKEMGFGNADVAKTEKWQCQEKFKAYLRQNPQIKNLLKENCYG